MATGTAQPGIVRRRSWVGTLASPTRDWLVDLPRTAPIFSIAVLTLLVVLPLLVMLIASVRPGGTFPLDPGPIVFSNFAEAYLTPNTLTMLGNTAMYATVPLLFAVPLAFGLAFLTERTDLPLRGHIYSVMFVPMSVPIFASAMSWFLLLGPRAGTLNMWIRTVLGLDIRDGPFNILTLPGMIFVHALGIVPSIWLILISVLRSMDPVLEEAAAVSGASRWRTTLVVTVPLMMPAILATLILFIVVGVESLETPLALGTPAGIEVLSTRVYDLLHLPTGAGFAYGPPAATGLLALLVGLIGMTVYLRLTRRASSYVVVSGKAFRPRLINLGRWKYAALAAIAGYLVLQVVLPFSILVATSFQRFYQPVAPGTTLVWTANNYLGMLDYRFFGQYFVNTIVVSVGAATITMLLVTLFAWQIVRVRSRLTQVINVLAFLPLGIPGVISGLAFFLLFIGTPLYGTLALLVLAFLARFIAYGTRLMQAAQVQIHAELEEAALVSGVSHLRAFLTVNLRLLLPAFFNGWLWVLVHAARDFTTPLMVASASSLLASNLIFGRYQDGKFPESAAMMVVLVAFNTCLVFGGRRWIIRALS